MKAIYNTSNDVVSSLVEDSATGNIPDGFSISATLTEYPSDINIYFYGTLIKGFKLSGTTVISRTFAELKADDEFNEKHSQFVALREVTTKRINDCGENKVFGLMVKKMQLGEQALTQSELDFISSYLTERDAIISEHDAHKQAILDSMVEVIVEI